MRRRFQFRLPAKVTGSSEEPPPLAQVNLPDEKHSSAVDPATEVAEPADEDNAPVPYGVRAAEAQVWTRTHLIIAYAVIWLIEFMESISYTTFFSLTPFYTSKFSAHELTSVTTVVSTLIGGLVKFPYSKYIDVFGRAQGLVLAVASLTIGLIMLAGCNNVKTYCAANVFYFIGHNCIDFSITVFIADTAVLRNRAFWIAYSSTPYIATTWFAPYLANSVVNHIGLRWGFGMWCIILPVVYAPLVGLFLWNERKALREGMLVKEPSGRTFWQSVVHYCVEFDVIGMIMLTAGWAFFLLAFSLFGYQTDGWRSPMIICFIIIGPILLIAFTLWERFFAPVKFLPWQLLTNRTVISTFTMVASLYMAWYIWDNTFSSLCLVVFRQTVTNTTYIGYIYTVGSCSWSILMGILIRYNGRIKWTALYFGVPITMLAVGLMIKFRQPDTNIGYIVMCQLFIAFGGGTLVMCEQMNVMAVSKHKDIPAILAMEATVANIGGSIGSTIASAMWGNIFPNKLREYLPASSQADLSSIYESVDVQLSYAPGTATRNAIDTAYGDTQRVMCITATCLYVITFLSVVFWKDINVKNAPRVKGQLM